MSTHLEDHGTHWVVATIQKQGKKRKIPRGRVKVGKSDPKALQAEIIKQATAARVRAGVAVE